MIDILGVLRQARDGSMPKASLIEVIVARNGAAQRLETTRAIEKMIAQQISKGRIAHETKKGTEYLTALR